MRIITNSDKTNDRMRILIKNQISEGTEVFIASAFFSDINLLKEITSAGCYVRLIVRLNFGTSPKALREALALPNVAIRFFTSTYFHPKLYIFGSRIAYVGSSNFTNSGLTTNQELNVEIDGEEPAFVELQDVFEAYWNRAQPLEGSHVKEFAKIIADIDVPAPSDRIHKVIGKYAFEDVEPAVRLSGKRLYIDSFKRDYQLYIMKFNVLARLYEQVGIRRFPDAPLRIEIDRFLWWVREYHAKGDSYIGVKIRSDEQILEILKELVPEFKEFNNKFLALESIPRYETIANNFSSPQAIKSLTLEQLVTTLQSVYAFTDRLRYFSGGLSTLIDVFLEKNTEEDIKKSITHLLFGKGDYQERLYDTIRGPYKLQEFGDNSVTELFGLVNDQDIPIKNGRTVKSMEWLGFGKL